MPNVKFDPCDSSWPDWMDSRWNKDSVWPISYLFERTHLIPWPKYSCSVAKLGCIAAQVPKSVRIFFLRDNHVACDFYRLYSHHVFPIRVSTTSPPYLLREYSAIGESVAVSNLRLCWSQKATFGCKRRDPQCQLLLACVIVDIASTTSTSLEMI